MSLVQNANGEPGIRAIATTVGEHQVDIPVFAASNSVPLPTIKRWLGTMKIFTTSREPTELAADAARKCLARASLDVEDIDAILWCSVMPLVAGRSELHFQQLLGAKKAFSIVGGTHCPELASSLWMADMMVRGWPGVRRVLIVSGEKYRTPWRTIDGLSPKVRYQPVFSDVGAAAIVEAGATTRMLGIGSATNATYWDGFQRVGRGEDGGPEGLVRSLVDASQLDSIALQRCLDGAGLTAADLHHYLLTRESQEIVEGIVRRMHLDPKRIVFLKDGPSHGGLSDGLFGLEALMHDGRGKPGENVLVCSRSFGIARFGVVQLGETSA